MKLYIIILKTIGTIKNNHDILIYFSMASGKCYISHLVSNMDTTNIHLPRKMDKAL